MGVISSASLKEEMVVAKDVVNKNGRVLIKAGTTIEKKHLKVLKIWGIASLEVEQETSHLEATSQAQDENDSGSHEESADAPQVQELDEEADSKEVLKIRKELIMSFRHVDYNYPLIQFLFHERVKNVLKGGSSDGS